MKLSAQTEAGKAAQGYSVELDRLEKLARAVHRFEDEKLWRESKAIADRTGPQIIHAVMYRARRWHGEEGLMFVPLIDLLPRGDTVKILKHYEQSTRESDRLYAHEFLIELEARDTKEFIKKFGL